jgi:hypothetical protein
MDLTQFPQVDLDLIVSHCGGAIGGYPALSSGSKFITAKSFGASDLSPQCSLAQNRLGHLPADVAVELASYNFPFKIGDADRPFDSVVGYFISDNTQD